MKAKGLCCMTLWVVSLLLVLAGCGKEHQFTVVAPAAYQQNMVFRSLAVEPFTAAQARYGTYLKTLVESGVTHEGYITVSQQKPDAIVSGRLDIGNIDKRSYNQSYKCTKYDQKKKYETTCTTYYFTKKATVAGTFSMQSTLNRQVATSGSKTYNFEKTWSSSSNSTEAETQAPTDEQVINSLLDQMAGDIVRAITPHKEVIKRKLQTGGDENLKLGVTYLENGRADQAVTIWEQITANTSRNQDAAAAHYNIGVVHESRGKYDEAFKRYSQANQLMPAETLYIKAMTNAEKIYSGGQIARGQQGK
jgi:tetratricopeptide (TPR) repeat protein